MNMGGWRWATWGTWTSGWLAPRSGASLAPFLSAVLLVVGCADEAPPRDAPPATAPDRDGDDLPAQQPIFPKETFVPPEAAPPPPVAPYAHLDPGHVVPKTLLDRAVAYFDANKSAIVNRNFLTVVDFKKHSGQKRFFVIDMKTGVVRSHVVAHGKMSDPDATGFATAFSNVPGSNQSSVGFAVTGETYYGAHGRSLRLEGLSQTNSNMFDRAIVIHSADYVLEGQAKQGRSLGCFVLDDAVKDDIVDLIQGGSLVYADLG